MSKLRERLEDGARSGVYRAGSDAAVRDALRGSKVAVTPIALPADADKTAILAALASALAFPDWFGGNWDALEDCMTDLSWRPAEGHVLLFSGARAGDDTGILVDVLRSAAEFWAGQRRPFFAVFIDPRRHFDLPDLYRGA